MSAPTYAHVPGVQIIELPGSPTIIGAGTSTAGFVGKAPKAGQFTGIARLIPSLDQFRADYVQDATQSTHLSRAVFGFFLNGGTVCYVVNMDSDTATDAVTGLGSLAVHDDVRILVCPGQTDPTVYTALEQQATLLGDRVALLDPPDKTTVGSLTTPTSSGGSRPADSIYSAFYYPKISVGPDLKGDSAQEYISPIGHIAGVYARVDGTRGVHKAPANEVILGSMGVQHALTDGDQDTLNPKGVNALRVFGGDTTIWGARTLQDASSPVNSDYLYVSTRRFVNYIETTLRTNLRWAVFEPNNLTLRKRIARTVRAFLTGVWNDGALFGATADDAFYVRFPDASNTDDDRKQGKLTMEIGLRIAYPAEFIIVQIALLSQSASTS